MTLAETPMTDPARRGVQRSPGLSYDDLLDMDTHTVPDVLRKRNWHFMDDADIPVARYTSREFHELEVEKVWTKVWQMACRGDDIPACGDSLVYDIAGLSILLIRQADMTIKAFFNVCLHRGRQLRDQDGNVAELRCSFHGFAWHNDGSMKQVPCEWDFPHVNQDQWGLKEVNVDQWGGFVFINMDPECESLASFLGELPEHFAVWELENRAKTVHVARLFRANWKVVQEAFMEAFHVVATHPQLLEGIGDANSQYDFWGNFSRAITPNGTPSPHIKYVPTEQQIFDSVSDKRLDQSSFVQVPDGMSARSVVGIGGRALWRNVLGDRVDAISDAEFSDSIYYTLFPNFHPWGAYVRIVYRFRPCGDNHEMSIMECMFLSPYDESQPKPPSAPIHWLGPDSDWTEAEELGFLARVFNQDTFNLPKVQIGLQTLKHAQVGKSGVTLANYQETKIRHFHILLDEWLAK